MGGVIWSLVAKRAFWPPFHAVEGRMSIRHKGAFTGFADSEVCLLLSLLSMCIVGVQHSL